MAKKLISRIGKIIQVFTGIYVTSLAISGFERILVRSLRNHSGILRLLLMFCIWTSPSFPLLPSWLRCLGDKHTCPFAFSPQSMLIEKSKLWRRINCPGKSLKISSTMLRLLQQTNKFGRRREKKYAWCMCLKFEEMKVGTWREWGGQESRGSSSSSMISRAISLLKSAKKRSSSSSTATSISVWSNWQP